MHTRVKWSDVYSSVASTVINNLAWVWALAPLLPLSHQLIFTIWCIRKFNFNFGSTYPPTKILLPCLTRSGQSLCHVKDFLQATTWIICAWRVDQTLLGQAAKMSITNMGEPESFKLFKITKILFLKSRWKTWNINKERTPLYVEGIHAILLKHIIYIFLLYGFRIWWKKTLT